MRQVLKRSRLIRMVMIQTQIRNSLLLTNYLINQLFNYHCYNTFDNCICSGIIMDL